MTALHLLPEDLLPLKLLGRIPGSEGRRPAAVQFPAAVMFIDVSRYTALNWLAAVERGLRTFRDYRACCTVSCSEHVAHFGGEVLYFAGDSLLAYWAAEVDQLGDPPSVAP